MGHPKCHKGRPRKYARTSYGSYLRYLRENAGLSQEETAWKMSMILKNREIHASTISYWESTGNMAGRFEISAMAVLYGVPVHKVLRLQLEHPNAILARRKDMKLEISPDNPPTLNEMIRILKSGWKKQP